MNKEYTFRFYDKCGNVVYVITTVGVSFDECCGKAINLADNNAPSWDVWKVG